MLSKCAITEKDTVLEIGPGRGTLTKKLAEITSNVIAVEKDPVLADELRQDPDLQHVDIIHADFLTWPLPKKPFKVFSNPPFNITSQIVKKLLWANYPPDDIYLFTQKEAAERFLGEPIEYELSIASKPFFSYSIMHRFERDDFSPVPNVDVVLLHIHQLEAPLVQKADLKIYRQFIHYGFSQQKKNLLKDLEDIFTYEQWKRLSKSLHFPLQILLRDLKFPQWLGLYEAFQQLVTDTRKRSHVTSWIMR